MTKILSIIPARGGSKGIPRKNIRLLNGKPLIAWTIGAALESGVIDKLVVSTEDAEIAEIARKYGAEVVDRPMELAGDAVLTEPVMSHALEVVEAAGYKPDYVSLIQCTSPFLNKEIIREAAGKVLNQGFNSCITCFLPDRHEFKWRKEDLDEHFIPEHDVERRPRRQDLPKIYHENGAFYITKTDFFKKTKNRFGGSEARVTAILMNETESLQIDNEHDLWLAELLMKKFGKK